MNKVTVILCTYNRSAELRNALASLASSQVSPSIDWQVVVVDNNSSDDTPAVVNEFIAAHPGRFAYLFEPKPGKSNALNRGLREVDGDILAFTDDVVESNWLENLTLPLRTGKDYDGVGGRTLPLGNLNPPRWFPVTMRYAFAPLAIFDIGLTPGETNEAPFGNNMAFRNQTFRRFGDFRRDLGPRPGSEIRCEDTEFALRVLSGGGRIWYEPTAVLYHTIAGKRLNRRYFLNWWRDKARADVRAFPPAPERFVLAGIPLKFLRRLLRWSVQCVCSPNPAERFRCRIHLATLMGTISEMRSLAHETATRQSEPVVSPAPAAETPASHT
jgi:glucosyl-dolichyl phosphate glucuronosyltransferase